MVFDAAGNLYGTTTGGGSHREGTVFKLAPNSHGSWTESVLHSFTGADGSSPYAAVVCDTIGNLYGTTYFGGADGAGTVFKLVPNSDGSWTESVLYSFTGGTDGGRPTAGVTFDAAGNLYGTTPQGGNLSACNLAGCGVVFKLTPNQEGSWTESVLYTFTGGTDGSVPFGTLIFDALGSLYSTTSVGGAGNGTVFKLHPNSDGSWSESVLYSFTAGKDGAYPSGLVFDTSGNLYGTTVIGGGSPNCSPNNGCGTAFKLHPNSDGSWSETVLHRFLRHPAGTPGAGLILDGAGNLYGSTVFGGPANSGVVFKLTPSPDGSWKYTVLYVFGGKPAANPGADLVLDKAGNLFGTTSNCGSGFNCKGVVFEIAP
jgi:uncharacterized repeat protein (TIGR03803 family)